MATLDDLRRLALALPQAHEVTYKGDPWFNVGKKTFALAPSDAKTGGRAILKLDRAHQELLFEARPDTFSPCKVATVHWAYVELAHLDEVELAALVREAWTQIVPKTLSRSPGSTGLPPTTMSPAEAVGEVSVVLTKIAAAAPDPPAVTGATPVRHQAGGGSSESRWKVGRKSDD